MSTFLTLAKLQRRFRYASDACGEAWRYPTAGAGPVIGDCEDFALQLAYDLAGQSSLKFWFHMLTLQSVIWYVRTSSGNGHAALWHRGRWSDNTRLYWYETRDMPHTRVFPFILPFVLIKFLITGLLRRN